MAKILIVDDDEDICALMQNAFRHAGHEVAVAYSGEEALEKLGSDKYDAMVLDLIMPGIGGSGVLDVQEDIPIVVYTGFASIDTAARAVKARNVIAYLQKHAANPMDAAKLIEEHLEMVQVGQFKLHKKAGQATYQDKPVSPGPSQMPLLKLFLENPDEFYTYEQLCLLIDGEELDGREALEKMRVRVHRLRVKLREAAGYEVIRTTNRGFGWSVRAKRGD